MLIACILLAFLVGLAVKHYRGLSDATTVQTSEVRDAKR